MRQDTEEDAQMVFYFIITKLNSTVIVKPKAIRYLRRICDWLDVDRYLKGLSANALQ